MDIEFFDLFEEARTHPTGLDRAFDKHSWISSNPRVSDDGKYLRNDLALERAVRSFRKLFTGERVRVEFKAPEQPNLLYHVEGALLHDEAYSMEFVGSNGSRRVDCVLVRTESGLASIPLKLVVNMERRKAAA